MTFEAAITSQAQATSKPNAPSWFCAQSGHRERYAIPCALERAGKLQRLVTDVWSLPHSWSARTVAGGAGRRLRDRYNPGLKAAEVSSFTWSTMAWEAVARVRGMDLDARGRARAARWSRLATNALDRYANADTQIVFSYCYEAWNLFLRARERGLSSILGQIDPGPAEDAKVAEIVRRWPDFRTSFRPGSKEYYRRWTEECQMARHIIVNSTWSRDALASTGVDLKKLSVVPLVFEPERESSGFQRFYPSTFSPQRPLRILFLGQCILRKGIAETLEAAQMLSDRPVEFRLVGNTDIVAFERHFKRARIRYHSRVSRAECHDFYRWADIFIFPTHSDGFGLTQLEAQAWRLPIIASPYCAQVVEAGRTGWILSEVSSLEIVRTVAEILANPSTLARKSAAISPWGFNLEQLGKRLAQLGSATAQYP